MKGGPVPSYRGLAFADAPPPHHSYTPTWGPLLDETLTGSRLKTILRIQSPHPEATPQSDCPSVELPLIRMLPLVRTANSVPVALSRWSQPRTRCKGPRSRAPPKGKTMVRGAAFRTRAPAPSTLHPTLQAPPSPSTLQVPHLPALHLPTFHPPPHPPPSSPPTPPLQALSSPPPFPPPRPSTSDPPALHPPALQALHPAHLTSKPFPSPSPPPSPPPFQQPSRGALPNALPPKPSTSQPSHPLHPFPNPSTLPPPPRFQPSPPSTL
nr:extensin-like [Salvelinus alpinus]